MDDRFIVKILTPHILRISAVVLMFFMLTVSAAYAGTGDEDKTKTNPESEKKSKDALKVGKVIPNILEDRGEIQNSPVNPYFETPFLDKEASASGEDQNAVLSFNVIQYIFQRFKFSEEGY